MSAGSSSSVGLGGLPTVSPQLQAAAMRAELLGVALESFPLGALSAEAVARADPGGAKATLTFSKSGQTLALPPELAAKLVGPSGGSAMVQVDLAGPAAEGRLAVSIRRASLDASAQSAPQAGGARAESAAFTPGALALAQASSIPLDQAHLWASLAREIARPATSPESSPAQTLKTPAEAFERGLRSLVPAAGVGFERAVAALSTMGPQAAQEALVALAQFPQAAGAIEASSPQWVAQQAAAKEGSQVMWSGQAWPGAPAWLALGAGRPPHDWEPDAPVPDEPSGASWLRFRAEPPGLGPIDLWAIWFGGSCRARLVAQPLAAAALRKAQSSFGETLAAARVELRVDTRAHPS